MIKDLTDLYPKACMVTKKDQLEDIDNIINEYNKIING
jgi:hypothetical protein